MRAPLAFEEASFMTAVLGFLAGLSSCASPHPPGLLTTFASDAGRFHGLEPSSRSTTGSSAKGRQRQELEKRLGDKLRKESEEGFRKANRIKTEKSLRLEVVRKTEEKSLLDSIYKQRQTTTLSLARFLCTSPPSAADSVPSALRSLADRPHLIPSHLPHLGPFSNPTQPSQPEPIYYLPYKLTRHQDQLILEQLKSASSIVNADRAEWAREILTNEAEIEELRLKRDQGLEEIEREERQERALAEREARDRAAELSHDDILPKEDVDMDDSSRGAEANPATETENEDSVEY